MNPAEELKKLAEDLESTQKQAQVKKPAEDFASYRDFIDYLENLGVSQITAMMNDYPAPHDWFPSGWSHLDWTEGYPKILAQALVLAKDKESITDLSNMYYARNRLSPEAVEIFKKDVLSDPAEVVKFLATEYLAQGLEGFATHDPSFVKSMLMMLNDKEMAEHVKLIQGLMKGPEADSYFKAVGIDPADYE